MNCNKLTCNKLAENTAEYALLCWRTYYVENLTEFVNSQKQKERGTSTLPSGSQKHFLTCHDQYGQRNVNFTSQSLSHVIRCPSCWSMSEEPIMGLSMSVMFSLSARLVRSLLHNNGKRCNFFKTVLCNSYLSRISGSHGCMKMAGCLLVAASCSLVWFSKCSNVYQPSIMREMAWW
jgi:hypothetical protein